jgi:hypothetical protein
MEPSALAVRLASSALGPLVARLFHRGTAGADLADRPVRLAALVSFRGEKRTVGEKELRRLARELVARAATAYGPHEAPGEATRTELADALATALHSLGDLDMDDVQAVRLGPERFAARLERPRSLSAAAEAHYDALLQAAALHILNHFTRRSAFVARTLVEQVRALDRLTAVTELLLGRTASLPAEDARFEERYAAHLVRRHGELTIYGIDLDHAREWPLDASYVTLTLDAAGSADTGPLPAGSLLDGRDRVLLRGGAGSGKTTLVQWLAVTAARQEYPQLTGGLSPLVGRVPFVLPLRRVIRDGAPPTPDGFLHAVRSAVAGAQPAGWADRVLAAGRALLLVDGIDEIPAPEREATRRWLRELTAEFPGNLWLVTARPSAVAEDWLRHEGFTELTLTPMTRRDTTAFVARWHAAAGAGDELRDALTAALRTDPALRRLAVNPLMCGLLCALHRERRGFLPSGRRDLYEAALRMLLERRDTERGIRTGDGPALPAETAVLILQKLAHWMIRNDRTEMDRADAVTQVGRALPRMAQITDPPEKVLTALLERSGLLREPAAGRVDFVHRTFQDHLGAKALVEEGDFPLLLDKARSDQWEDLVRMAVAQGRPAERARILTGLVAGRDDRPLSDAATVRASDPSALRAVLLAASCLEHATELEPSVRESVLALTRDLVPPRDTPLARLLGDIGGPLLLGLLPGPAGLTDEQAVHVVITAARIGTEAALPLLARYRDHPALAVRRQLAWSWHRFGTREYAAEIIGHLDPADLYFTAHGAEQLAALRELGGRPRIQVTGRYNPDDLVRLIEPETLTHLWLRDGYRARPGEEWLLRFPRLRTLVLPEPEPATSARGRAPSSAPEVPAHVAVTRIPPGGTP